MICLANIAQEIAVMYSGIIVERGACRDVFYRLGNDLRHGHAGVQGAVGVLKDHLHVLFEGVAVLPGDSVDVWPTTCPWSSTSPTGWRCCTWAPWWN